jgi:hypothetical protein
MNNLRLRAMREDRGRFAALRNERVLIYWPHGLGDWVHLAAVLPLLEPSNAYAIARFGDDYSSVLDGNAHARVLPSGVRALGDGSAQGSKDLGLDLRKLDGRPHELEVPEPFARALAEFDPSVVLWSDYPETEGRTEFPFHTKARNLASLLVSRERLATFDLTRPLATTLAPAAPEVQAAIDERLQRFAPAGTKRYVLSRAGFTAERKNWDAAEARAFVRLLQRSDPHARVVAMEDPALGDESAWPGRDAVAGYRELFGDVDAPFARAFLALLARTDALVGVPAGPFHVAMVRGGFPIVGIWVSHLPEWYDEPNPDAVHLIGSAIRERGFDRRAATKTLPAPWHREQMLDVRMIPAETVLAVLKA